MLKLTVIQLIIKTLFCQKLSVRALLYYVAVLHNEYYVGALYSRQPMRHYKRRLAFCEFVKRSLNLHFGTGIY